MLSLYASGGDCQWADTLRGGRAPTIGEFEPGLRLDTLYDPLIIFRRCSFIAGKVTIRRRSASQHGTRVVIAVSL